jgi:hypothetical protein
MGDVVIGSPSRVESKPVASPHTELPKSPSLRRAVTRWQIVRM